MPTPKQWKATQAVGVTIVVLCAFVFFWTVGTFDRYDERSTSGIWFGFSLLGGIAGVAVYLLGRAGAWWFHE